MNTVAEIEAQFATLSAESQLELLERLRHRTAGAALSAGPSWESQLAQMATDSQVQIELASISAEFAAAEADGLERS